MRTPGSQGLVQRLVDDYYVALFRYAFRLCGSSTEAEDLTQETYCKAQSNLGQLRDPGCAKPWLFRILRNVFLHKVRSDGLAATVPLDEFGDLPERLPEPLPEVDAEQLQQALSELPEVYRTPIILYYFEDFSYRDIAEQMDLPIGTVMSRLARAKAHLRKRLFPAAAVAQAPSHTPVPFGRANNGL